MTSKYMKSSLALLLLASIVLLSMNVEAKRRGHVKHSSTNVTTSSSEEEKRPPVVRKHAAIFKLPKESLTKRIKSNVVDDSDDLIYLNDYETSNKTFNFARTKRNSLVLSNHKIHKRATEIGNKVCPPNACGDGECVLTSHPTYQFACKCKDGSYKFEPCTSSSTTTVCASNPCLSKPCIEAPNSPSGFVCQCGTDDYRPTNCETSASACTATSCSNGGTCVPYSATEKWCNPAQLGQTCCQCMTGFTGLRCETDINECASNPCLNGGICDNRVNSYQCRCLVGFTGTNCEHQYNRTEVENSEQKQLLTNRVLRNDKATMQFLRNAVKRELITYQECPASMNICYNQGVCWLYSTGYMICACPLFTTGIQCETKTDNSVTSTTSVTPTQDCTKNPCLNGGICTPTACICPSGYSGQFCQTLQTQYLCRNVVCENGGICNAVLLSGIPTGQCWCIKGYEGYHCELKNAGNLCSQTQCLNGGTCEEKTPGVTTYAYCICKPGFTGKNCETEYFKCSSNGIFPDKFGCESGRYLECAHYGQSQIGFPNGVLYRRECPPGLRYNQVPGYCDYAANVNCNL